MSEAPESDRVRLRLDLAYDGTFFHGWAKQPGLRTVQGVVEEALATILQAPAALTVAGRTDAGVHAERQVAHVDVPAAAAHKVSASRVQRLLGAEYGKLWRREAVAAHLTSAEGRSGTSDVVIRAVEPVASSFDARFSAIGRQYRYVVDDRAGAKDPLTRFSQWWVGAPLEVTAMSAAAEALVGTRDFLSFCRPREGATTIRNLRRLDVTRAAPEAPVEFFLEADAFCHTMVRSIVGALVEVGRGRRAADWVENLLAEPSRTHGVPVAPARGLTLTEVRYPPQREWASRADEAKALRTLPGDGEESGTLPLEL